MNDTKEFAMLRRTTHLALGTALLAAAATFAPAAHADRVGFNVSIGGPGYGVSFGNGPYWRGHHHYRPYWSAAYIAPPVVYASPIVYAPPVVYSAPVVYRAPRVVYRAPYVVRHPVVVRGPVYYGY
jgi:hypothetical protein